MNRCAATLAVVVISVFGARTGAAEELTRAAWLVRGVSLSSLTFAMERQFTPSAL